MRKRIFTLILAATMVASLAACGNSSAMSGGQMASEQMSAELPSTHNPASAPIPTEEPAPEPDATEVPAVTEAPKFSEGELPSSPQENVPAAKPTESSAEEPISEPTPAPVATPEPTETPTEVPAVATEVPESTPEPTEAPKFSEGELPSSPQENIPTEAPTPEPVATPEPTPEPASTEAPHEHSYSQTGSTAATCTDSGSVSYTCSCGDSYTNVVPASGHSFGSYAYNGDATYDSDGTETAVCSSCGAADVRTASGTKMERPSCAHEETDIVEDRHYSIQVGGCYEYDVTLSEVCKACGHVLQTKEAKGASCHNQVVVQAGKTPTCTEDGNGDIITCDCGKNYADKFGIVFPATGHHGAGFCTYTGEDKEENGLFLMRYADHCIDCGVLLEEYWQDLEGNRH